MVDDILEKYPNDVKVVVKNFPLSFHKQAYKAAQYSLAAHKQGKYKDIIVVYGKVGIKEDQETDTARLSFTYNLQDPADFDPQSLEKDEYFKNYLGAILQHIIKENSCICGDLVNEIGLAQPTISQHLKELKNSGIIKGNIEGNSICYCIDLENWKHIKSTFTSFFQFSLNVMHAS